jgi:hypothetical protein
MARRNRDESTNEDSGVLLIAGSGLFWWTIMGLIAGGQCRQNRILQGEGQLFCVVTSISRVNRQIVIQ